MDESQQLSQPPAVVSGKLYNLDDVVKVWSDFLHPHVHPRSLHIIDTYQHNRQVSFSLRYVRGRIRFYICCWVNKRKKRKKENIQRSGTIRLEVFDGTTRPVFFNRGSAEPKGSVSARRGFHRWPVRK